MHKILPILLSLISIFSISKQLFAHDDAPSSKPIVFVPNLGQWESNFLYKGLSGNADIYLETNGVTYVVGDANNNQKRVDAKEGRLKGEQTLSFHAYKTIWKNANTNARLANLSPESYYHNYYLGKDPSRWKGNVGVYKNVIYNNIYKNIDVSYYSEDGNLKYDFIVKPGGNINDIVLQFQGTDGLQLNDGLLTIKTSVGNIIELKPYTYQYIDGKKVEVTARYKLKNNEISFVIDKSYNNKYNLIIDPTIVFASLTGSTADNWGFTATYDAAGNLYGGGIVNGNGYPTSLGAFRTTFSGGTSPNMPCDVAISKFNAVGNSLLYSTYLGGFGDDMPHSMVVDNTDRLIVVGKTFSTNFPVTGGVVQQAFGGGESDIFVTKFNVNGTALDASTFLGGSGTDGINISSGFDAQAGTLKYNYGDNSRSEVIVDNQNNIYLVANTQSTNFPVTLNAAKNSRSGFQDAIFVKYNPALTTMLYSSYLGGNGEDAAYVIALDKNQSNIFIAGGTNSSDFFTNYAGGSLGSNYKGEIDGFIIKIQNSGNFNVLRATYIGTPQYDQVYGIQLDNSNNVYVMGQTLGNFPVSGGVYNNPGSRQFVQKIDNNLNTSIYSTVFGNGPASVPNLSLVAFLVDTCENVYMSGWGGTSITPGSTTQGLPITQDAFQSNTDGSDFYFIVLSKNAQNLLFGSFFGAFNKGEHVDGGTSRFDPKGIVYQSMCASCGQGNSFPSTPGAFATVKGGQNCNMGVVKIAFNLGSVDAVADANPNTKGCAPFTVTFNNNSSNAINYAWDFGDGLGTSNAISPTYVYNTPGVYKVKLVATNPNACVVIDSTFITITVTNDTLSPAFTHKLIDSCVNFTVQFTNTSHTPTNNNTYSWSFGDGTFSSAQNPPIHSYPGPGTYNVLLKINNPDACDNPDSVMQVITITNNNVEAILDPIDNLCTNDSILFNNTSFNATSYFWDFGDGRTSTQQNPVLIYTTAGNYTITFVAINPASCNGTDTLVLNVDVKDGPIADFTYLPLQPEKNTPVKFRNHSVGANRYAWSFGDDRYSNEFEPVHEYYKSGTYKVCLTAYNEYDCDNTVCKNVTAIVQNVVDVPTGFSPNGDGKNDRLYVRGYNIATIDFKIYNRWGVKVYDSNDINEGWDGMYKEVVQEMDAFAWTLTVEFRDGTKTTKKGNVTLLQ